MLDPIALWFALKVLRGFFFIAHSLTKFNTRSRRDAPAARRDSRRFHRKTICCDNFTTTMGVLSGRGGCWWWATSDAAPVVGLASASQHPGSLEHGGGGLALCMCVSLSLSYKREWAGTGVSSAEERNVLLRKLALQLYIEQGHLRPWGSIVKKAQKEPVVKKSVLRVNY